MKRKDISQLAAMALLLLTGVTSCYKEDAQILYSRQYVTSVSLKDLQALADDINGKIAGLQGALSRFQVEKPIVDLEPDIQDGEQVGAWVTWDDVQLYVPFGKNGKDGRDGKDGQTPAFDVSIGADGFWYINGKKTEHTAIGPAGPQGPAGGTDTTPTITISTDGYWVINGVKSTQKAQGPAGQDGQDGQDGTDGQDGRDGRDGRDGTDGTDGEDGVTPTVTISTDG